MILFPCVVDGVEYHNLREAHRAVFLKEKIGYDRFQRSLKRGKTEFYGHVIKKIERRYDVSQPLRPDDDGADLVLCPPEKKPDSKHGGQLLRYPPGESPLERGIPPVQH